MFALQKVLFASWFLYHKSHCRGFKNSLIADNLVCHYPYPFFFNYRDWNDLYIFVIPKGETLSLSPLTLTSLSFNQCLTVMLAHRSINSIVLYLTSNVPS